MAGANTGINEKAEKLRLQARGRFFSSICQKRRIYRECQGSSGIKSAIRNRFMAAPGSKS